MPGITVTTDVRSGPSGNSAIKPAQFFVVGSAERGPVDKAMLVRGMNEYRTYYGDYAAGNLYLHLQTFFEEGGGRAIVYRALSSDASVSYLDLLDQAASPVPTLRVSASSPGDWGDRVDVAVTAGDAANTFKLSFYYDDVLLYTTRDLTDPADAENVVNVSGINHLVTVTDLLSVTAAPDNNPAVAVATALSGGADGSALIADDYIAGLDFFTYDMGCGAVAIPGQHGSDVWEALAEHADTQNRVALCAFGENDDAASVKAEVAGYYADPDAEHMAFYYPWITVPSPAVRGIYINISPEAYVAASRARAIFGNGPWQPGAGLPSEARFVHGLVTPIDRSTGDDLDAKRINALRTIAGKVRVYGARSVSSDEDNWRYITYQDVINYIVTEAEARLEDLLFSPVDARGALFARIESALIGLLEPIRIAGGLYEAYDDNGKQIDKGYSVRVTSDLNPAENLMQGIVTAAVGVRVSSVGDQIVVTITKSNLTASV